MLASEYNSDRQTVMLILPPKPEILLNGNVVLLLDVVVVLVVVIKSTKAFSFRNRSSLNFAYGLVTILSTVAPWHSRQRPK